MQTFKDNVYASGVSGTPYILGVQGDPHILVSHGDAYTIASVGQPYIQSGNSDSSRETKKKITVSGNSFKITEQCDYVLLDHF